MTGSEKTAADFVAIVTKVLATVLESMEPPPVIRPEDVAGLAAGLAKRVMAVYPHPRRGPLVGVRAIVDEYGPDSWYALRAVRAVRAYQTAIVASRLARLRSDGHASQAEALLRLLEARNVDEPPVIASRHGRTLAPVFGVRAVADASGLDPREVLSMVMPATAGGSPRGLSVANSTAPPPRSPKAR
jgi:hypothetical protein